MAREWQGIDGEKKIPKDGVASVAWVLSNIYKKTIGQYFTSMIWRSSSRLPCRIVGPVRYANSQDVKYRANY